MVPPHTCVCALDNAMFDRIQRIYSKEGDTYVVTETKTEIQCKILIVF